MSIREHNGTIAVGEVLLGGAGQASVLTVWPLLAAALLFLAGAGLALPAPAQTLAQAEGVTEEALPLPEPPAGHGGPEVARLKEAFQQMKAENPVVARVNGHEIRWAEVVNSADDLPQRYHDQLESVFPALLDRLVDLRLLADAARDEGLEDNPEVRQRIAAYEDRVLSAVLLERYLDTAITTAALRERYDAMVAARRADQEIRARHILLDSEEAAEEIIERLDRGEVFISLAAELSQGSSAQRGGDLGYFLPSRMSPAFAEAALSLEPGDYTRAPVRTEFGWHVILLVDRRADDIPSFLDMQDKLREEATNVAVDRLLLRLRDQAALEMFPADAGTSERAQ